MRLSSSKELHTMPPGGGARNPCVVCGVNVCGQPLFFQEDRIPLFSPHSSIYCLSLSSHSLRKEEHRPSNTHTCKEEETHSNTHTCKEEETHSSRPSNTHTYLISLCVSSCV